VHFRIWASFGDHERAWHWPGPFSFDQSLLASAMHSLLTLKLKYTHNPVRYTDSSGHGVDGSNLDYWDKNRRVYPMR
jgi:hypothetical protein